MMIRLTIPFMWSMAWGAPNQRSYFRGYSPNVEEEEEEEDPGPRSPRNPQSPIPTHFARPQGTGWTVATLAAFNLGYEGPAPVRIRELNER